MTKTKPQGIARVIESIDTEALKAAAVGDKAAVKIYDAIHDILSLSTKNIPAKNRGLGMRVDGRKGRKK